MAKKKYVSEREIVIGKKSYWLTKTDDHIKVVDGEKVVYDGKAQGFHKWLRGKTEKRKK